MKYMTSIVLRTLTKKSKLGVWKITDTIQNLLDRKDKRNLVQAYFKLTTINYTDDILDELGITSKWKIKKPGANKDLYYEFLKANNWSSEMTSKKSRGGKADKLKGKNILLSKSSLQSKNHGR